MLPATMTHSRGLRDRLLSGLLRALPLGEISAVVGWLADRRTPDFLIRSVIARFVAVYGVDLTQAVVPEGGFRSFNEFFTRRLRDGLRPIDPDPGSVVSPADGRIEFAGTVDEGAGFTIKGETYTVASLLASEPEGRRFAGGCFAVVYLSPRDYHRVHSPFAGEVRRVRHLPGALLPVNPFGVRNYPGLFARNQRVVVGVDSEEAGAAAVVLVGATIVGRIRLALPGLATPFPRRRPFEQHFAAGAGPRLERGQELGSFELGSTAVVLLPPVAGSRWQLAGTGAGGAVRMGERLARIGGGAG